MKAVTILCFPIEVSNKSASKNSTKQYIKFIQILKSKPKILKINMFLKIKHKDKRIKILKEKYWKLFLSMKKERKLLKRRNYKNKTNVVSFYLLLRTTENKSQRPVKRCQMKK